MNASLSMQAPAYRRALHPGLVIVLTAALIGIVPTISAEEFDPAELVDLAGLRTIDANWEIAGREGHAANGRLRVNNDKWLMYFLHWRPLTEAKPDLTHEYARHHLLNFWGENMPFVLSGVEGETEINGHRALITEGTIYDSTVATRFIVWNCPETGRQFTADCNINLRVGTPAEYLEVQRKITESIRCHPPHKTAPTDALPASYGPSPWQVAFSIPDGWRTNDFEYKEWYPDGLTADNGSLWTLLSDSEKRFRLRWTTSDEPVSESSLRNLLESLPQDSAIVNDTALTLQVEVDSVWASKGGVNAGGNLIYIQTFRGKEYPSSYAYRALQWRKGDRLFSLIASMATVDSFWDMPVDLVPSAAAVDGFLQNEVLTNLPIAREH